MPSASLMGFDKARGFAFGGPKSFDHGFHGCARIRNAPAFFPSVCIGEISGQNSSTFPINGLWDDPQFVVCRYNEPRTEGTPEVSGFEDPLTSGALSVRGSFVSITAIIRIFHARCGG
jgi:hypothetical protein